MSAKETQRPETPKPIIYSCSGCSDAGELADLVARRLSKQGVGEMSCLAGIGGRVKPLMMKAQKAQHIIAVDGCPLNCARHTLEGAGFNQFEHVELHKLGHRKGSCPVTEERVVEATRAAADLIYTHQNGTKQN
jgi:uncharacterized metal-binding protein